MKLRQQYAHRPQYHLPYDMTCRLLAKLSLHVVDGKIDVPLNATCEFKTGCLGEVLAELIAEREWLHWSSKRHLFDSFSRCSFLTEELAKEKPNLAQFRGIPHAEKVIPIMYWAALITNGRLLAAPVSREQLWAIWGLERAYFESKNLEERDPGLNADLSTNT